MNESKRLTISGIEMVKVDETQHPYIINCFSLWHQQKRNVLLSTICTQLNLPQPNDVLIKAGLFEPGNPQQ